MKSFAKAAAIAAVVFCLMAVLSVSSCHAGDAAVIEMAGLDFMGTSAFRWLASFGIVAVIAFIIATPLAVAKFKASVDAAVSEKLKGIPQLKDAVVEKLTGVTGESVDADKIVQQRVLALKGACSKAVPELLLKWLEAGHNDSRAREEYIKVLESQVADKVSGK